MDSDRLWGGKPGSAGKALSSMEQHYGVKEGRRIFGATTAQRRATGKGNALMDAISSATKSRKDGENSRNGAK